MNSDSICDINTENLISYEDVISFIKSTSKSIQGSTVIPLSLANGRILYGDITSPLNVPVFDNSAMDGYGVNAPSSVLGKPGIKEFNVTSRITAGDTGSSVIVGDAVRIFTGAAVPQGVNAIIPQEDCDNEDGVLSVYPPINHGSNIRPAGMDVKIGNILAKKGDKLQFDKISILASTGVSSVEVYSVVTVGIFFTGNEIVNPGTELGSGKIYDSNQFALLSMLQDLGCEVINLGIIPDDINSTKSALSELKSQVDLIISTGGVSVGDEDYIKDAITDLGSLDLWKVKMKPGKPVSFGEIGGTKFIGLPGNPVSSIITFLLFATPFIKKFQGRNDYLNKFSFQKINFDWSFKKTRREFLRVNLSAGENNNKGNLLARYGDQNSNILSSITFASGLAELEELKTYKKNDYVKYYNFREILS